MNKERIVNRLSFHKTGFRLLTILHSLDSSAIPLAILNAILEAASPYVNLFLSAEIIDLLIASSYKNALILSIVMILLNFSIGMLVNFLENINTRINYSVQMEFRILLRKKGLELDYETMEKAGVVDKINFSERTASMYGGIDAVLRNYKKLLSLTTSIITAISMVILMCFSKPTKKDGFLSVIGSIPASLFILVGIIVLMLVFTRKISLFYTKKHDEIYKNQTGVEIKLTHLVNQVLYNYEAGKVVRIYDMKDMLLDNISKFTKKSRNLFKAMGDITRAQLMADIGVNSIFTIFTYFLVVVKILAGAISVGSFTKYSGALAQFGTSVNELIWTNEAIKKNCSYMKEFLEFMDIKNKHATGTIPVEKRLDNKYEIEFHNVSFAYPGSEDMILKNVNCKIALKDKMAVVGRNGAGKTTFIKLLCRLYDPTEGTITLNGVDIRKYNYEEYLRLFAVVFQDFNLFAFPIGENVASSKETDEDKIWKCLDQAGVADSIKGRPKGIHTPLYKYDEGGIELSGGQAQKVAIARALYKDAPFVILDEPTAALDPISEHEIYQRFDDMVKGKTSIYISHRMSSCRFCDDILVFDHGEIVERGSHKVLLELHGNYAKLWNAQAQYYA